MDNIVLDKSVVEQKTGRGRGRPRKNSPDGKPSENQTNEIINKIAIIENDEDNTSYEIKYKREKAINNVLSDTILNLIRIKNL